MDKEFLDQVLACKTADELRALLNSRRPLSDGELEQVNGGASGIKRLTKDELDSFVPVMRAVENHFGKNLAADLLSKCYPDTGLRKIYLGQDGLDGVCTLIRKQIIEDRLPR